MADSEIRFDRDDINLEPIPVELCTECDERPARFYLQIELRSEGWTTSVGERSGYCLECGELALERIRATMPERLNEDGVQP